MLASQAQTRAKFPIPQFRFNCRLNAPLLSFSSAFPLTRYTRVSSSSFSSSSSPTLGHTIASLRGRSTAKDSDIFAIIRFPATRLIPPSCARRIAKSFERRRTSIDRREKTVMKLCIIRKENSTRIRPNLFL